MVTLPGTPAPSLTMTGVTQIPAEIVQALTVSPPNQTPTDVPGTTSTPRAPLSVFTLLAGIVIFWLIIFTLSTGYAKK